MYTVYHRLLVISVGKHYTKLEKYGTIEFIRICYRTDAIL